MPVEKIYISDVTPLSIGIGCGRAMDRMYICVPKNTSLPHEYESTFFTSYDNQKDCTFKLFEGERPVTKENNYLGSFTIDNLP